MTGGSAAAGSSRSHRLDPHALPARAVIASGDAAGAVFIIDRERAVVVRKASGGRAVTSAVPLADYAGVAIRVEPNGAGGRVRVFVELVHDDPSLTLPLAVAEDPDDVAADWQAWGRALNLPLLVVAQDGTVSAPVGRLGRLTIAPAKPRRYHSFFAARRPRFLARRKPGRHGPAERIQAREIIARD